MFDYIYIYIYIYIYLILGEKRNICDMWKLYDI